MIRNIKVLGLALVAMLAFAAVAASGASAQTKGELTTENDQSVTLDMTELPGKTNALTGGSGIVECVGSTLTGHRTLTHTQTTEGKTHQLLQPGDTQLTVTPHYTNCHSIVGGTTHKTTVTMNGCDYHVTVGETIENTNDYAVSADLACPPNKDVVIDVYPFAGSELGGVACSITIKPQAGLTGPVLKNVAGTPDDLTVEGTFKNIKSSQSGFGCESTESETDELHLNVTIEGTAGGEKVGITVSH